MDLQDEIKALKERIAELERQQEFPRDGDTYWYVGMRGNIFTSQWEGFPSEEHMLEVGNIFKTEDEAELSVGKLKVEAELRKHSRPYEHGRFNYFLFFDIESDSLVADFTSYCPPQGAIYFESEEKVQQAIKSVGEERIKKYIFGVEDYYG